MEIHRNEFNSVGYNPVSVRRAGSEMRRDGAVATQNRKRSVGLRLHQNGTARCLSVTQIF